MEKSYALRKSNKNFVIATSFFLMLSIPLIVYELLNQKTTFDTREDAFEEIEVSEENPCVISLPNVNPYTLEVGKSIRVLVDAEVEDGGGITSLSIADTTGESIFSQTYGDSPNVISSSFIYTPSKTGIISLLGAIKKADGTSLGCKISSPYDVQGLQAISNNSAPEFTTDPNDSTPSRNLSTGTEYSYTVKAKDIDKDRINYFVYFTPGENWLKQTVIKDGSDGNLEIIFKGQPDKAASYLVSVLAHDGYSNHLSTQTWVLNVSPNANDTPDVKITAPAEGTRLTVGDMLSVSWTASDLNMIVKYELYITKYPFDESKWIPINTDIQFSRATYEYNTSKLEPGTYNLIVRAIDNQDPAGVGMALSQEVIIADKDGNVPETPVLTPEKEGNKNQEKGKEDDKEKEKIDTDDSIYLKIPQVINMTPSETDSFADKKVMIKGTIIPSINASIDDDTIMFKLDDEDITKKISINKIGNGEYTLIYQPEEDLGTGEHKAIIAFTDTNGLAIEKAWSFTIADTTPQTNPIEQHEEETDTYTIFGYKISKKIITIIGVGILIIILATIFPFVLSSVWKEENKVKEEAIGTEVLPSTPQDETHYSPITTNNDLRDKMKLDIETIKNTSTEEKVDAVTTNNDNTFEPAIPTEEELRELQISTSTNPSETATQEEAYTPIPTYTEETVQEEYNPPIPQFQEPIPQQAEEPAAPEPEPITISEETFVEPAAPAIEAVTQPNTEMIAAPVNNPVESNTEAPVDKDNTIENNIFNKKEETIPEVDIEDLNIDMPEMEKLYDEMKTEEEE